MSQEPLVSIIINNYNYQQFLGDAIDSALRQTYPRVEVIVVDDGSTDNSSEVIAGYGDRVIPVLKENGGQASAFNAGFAQSQGSIIIFLDSDDSLLPQTAERVAAILQANPNVAKVQYRLEIIDGRGVRTGVVKPPDPRRMLSGDLQRHVLQFSDDIPWLPTSGNAFPADVLRRIFPVPEHVYRICADYYVSNLTALLGKVVSLEEVAGYYRVHTRNSHHTPGVNLDQTRQIIMLTCKTHEYIKKFAELPQPVGDV
jgi:glycosyltransferase involved in cell wall biosynthesis